VTNAGRLIVCQQNAFAKGRMWMNNGASWLTTGNAFVGSYGDGLLTVSNASFQTLANLAVGVNGATATGRVEIAGTQRVCRVGTLTVGVAGANGAFGYITNHIARYAGGVDITNTAPTALTISTNGSRIHLSFEENPRAIGDFWGLRWLGDHRAELAAFTNGTPPRLTWDDSALIPYYQGKVGIYTNVGYTYVGFFADRAYDQAHGVLVVIQ
jgi:hypothetical protein